MAADFSTHIEMRGDSKDLLAMLKILRKFETEMYEQYCQKRNCAYIQGVCVGGGSDYSDSSAYELEDMNDDEWLEFIEENCCEIYADVSGPWGIFGFLDEIDLFKEMAEAAPRAEFKGTISGWNAGGDQDAEFELKDGLLYCKYAFPGDEIDEECDEDDENWDDDDDEIEWTLKEVYDPATKKIIE